MKKNKLQKPYDQMNTAELRAATKEFDKEITRFPPGRAMNAKQEAEWEAAKARGRPRVGEGVKVISLSVEQKLLRKADARAKAEGISRAELVARALAAVL